MLPRWDSFMILNRKFNRLWRSHFSTGVTFHRMSVAIFGVMTRFLHTKNDPSGRKKLTPGHFFDVEKWLGLLFDGGHYSSLLAILRYYISLNMGKKSRRTKGRRQSGIIWIRTLRYFMYQVNFVRRYTLLIIEMTSIPFKEHTATIHTDTWWN